MANVWTLQVRDSVVHVAFALSYPLSSERVPGISLGAMYSEKENWPSSLLMLWPRIAPLEQGAPWPSFGLRDSTLRRLYSYFAEHFVSAILAICLY